MSQKKRICLLNPCFEGQITIGGERQWMKQNKQHKAKMSQASWWCVVDMQLNFLF